MKNIFSRYLQKLLRYKKAMAYIGIIFVSILVTSVAFFYKYKHTLLRNSFLEQRHYDNLALVASYDQQKKIDKINKQQESQDRFISSREGDLLHKIFYNSNGKFIDIETTDINTKEVVSEYTDNSYFRLIKKLDGFGDLELFLKSDDNRKYAIFELGYGYSAYEIYVASVNKTDDDFKIKSFLLEPTNGKIASLTGRNFYDYYPSSKQILMQAGMGDGCGGGGSFYLLSESGKMNSLQEYGYGCNIGDHKNDKLLPRFLGYIHGKLYFSDISVSKKNEKHSWETTKINKIYSLDPLTKVKKYLSIDFSDKNFDGTWVKKDSLITSSELVIYDKDKDEVFALDVDTLEMKSLGKSQD